VTTTPDSATAAIFGSGVTVLCSHHQSIDRLGTGLTPTAFADDGVIEAIELPGPPFVLGVQWHPEEGADQRPFAALVEAARSYRATRRAGQPHEGGPAQ
jgi:putative glutamine amidotransferase